MHKSYIILLDNANFWGLNREQALAFAYGWQDDNYETALTGKRCNYFLYGHKTMVQMVKNSLKKVRESLLMSKSELAREANVSPITITRIEEGKPCRLETKRKILLALGYSLSDSKKIFGE
jgi:DNA-binding XRE family transcriptional regulator